MIIKIKENTSENDLNSLINELKANKLEFEKLTYLDKTFLLVDKSGLEFDYHFIDEVVSTNYPFKLVSRDVISGDVIVGVDSVKFGGSEDFVVIAGPCSIEDLDSLNLISKRVKASGAKILRAGAFKPRTSPYSFLGLKEEGLRILNKSKEMSKISNISEIMDFDDIELFKDVDILQVGARNMQNFALLEKLAKVNKPILLKRGFSNTIEEWLLAAEYLVTNGNPNVILCERGIRTFEPYTRNTLDLSVISIVKEISNLPIIVDPSHASGNSKLVSPLTLAAYVAGADGVMLEVSDNPDLALSDGQQSLSLDEFDKLMLDLKQLSSVVSKKI